MIIVCYSSIHTITYYCQVSYIIANHNSNFWNSSSFSHSFLDMHSTATQIVGRMHIQETVAKATTISEIGIMIGYK